jgi:outer membrane receptor for ferrienterochelin and colicin
MFIPTRNRAALGSCALLFSFLSSHSTRAAEAAPDIAADSVESVVVTATRSARSINDVPESVSVVSAQAIADTPGQALDDILRRRPPSTCLTELPTSCIRPQTIFRCGAWEGFVPWCCSMACP